MISIRFEIENESKLYLDSLPKKLEKGVARSILWSMNFAEQESKGSFIQGITKHRPPPTQPPTVLTSRSGRLRSSIRASVGKDSGFLTTDVPYGPIHEFGLGVYPQRTFIERGFTEDNVDKMCEVTAITVIEEILKK